MGDTRLIGRWLPIADVGDGRAGNARVSPASPACGPAMVRVRAGHERSQERHACTSERRTGGRSA